MNLRWFIFAFAGALLFCARAQAAVVVTTNMNGADAEVREEELGTPLLVDLDGDPITPPQPVPIGVNRGTNMELATRLKDSSPAAPTSFSNADRTSVMYLKFDVTDANGVTDSVLGLANRTLLRLTTRNSANQRWNRIFGPVPYNGGGTDDPATNPGLAAHLADPANYTRVKFNVLGLQNFAHPNYNWSESGVANTWNPVTSPVYGPEGSITWYNAPGITPDNRTSIAAGSQDPGKWNFNSDMLWLGEATLSDPGLPSAVPPPFPSIKGAGSAAHCVGCVSFEFKDTDGRLHDLVEDARTAGQSHITLAVHMSLDGIQNFNPPDPDGGGPEPDPPRETVGVTPDGYLNFNYLFNPKEMDASTGSPNGQPGLQLNDDPNYNTDWTDLVDNTTGLPPVDNIADNGLTGPGPNTQMLPHPVTNVLTRYGAQNDNGRFSPQLVFFVPEPSSFALALIGALAAGLTRGRRK